MLFIFENISIAMTSQNNNEKMSLDKSFILIKKNYFKPVMRQHFTFNAKTLFLSHPNMSY
jgi:hypothetical protein